MDLLAKTARHITNASKGSPEATTIQAMTTLDIVPYDARWPLAFIEERDRIAVALGPLALRIEHHGSTSVVGLAAKPVIDIQVSVATLHPLDRYITPLASESTEPLVGCLGVGDSSTDTQRRQPI
jgi:GrpB-like predicted nucleotidyltransferase (UPF0157 family)